MKKNIFIMGLAFAFFAVGCQKEDVSAVKPENNLVELEFTAVAPATKTYFGDKVENVIGVNWHAGDEIMMGLKNNYLTIQNSNEAGAEAKFVVTLTEDQLNKDNSAAALNGDNKELFFYPSSAVITQKTNTFEASSATRYIKFIKLPDAQTLTPNSFDPKANLSVALCDVATETELHFINLCSMMGIGLKGDAKIKQISITSTQYLASDKLYITCKDNTKSTEEASFLVQNSGTWKKTITLTPESGTDSIDLTQYPDGVKFFSCVMPCTLKDNYQNNVAVGGTTVGIKANSTFTVAITNDSDKTITKTFTAGKNYVAGEVYALGTFTVNEAMFN